MTGDWKPGEPNLQLDLETLIVRLEQVVEMGGWDEAGYVAERILTCDLRRLQNHLKEGTPKLLTKFQALSPQDQQYVTWIIDRLSRR